MSFKKILIISAILLILSLTAVSAADFNDMNVTESSPNDDSLEYSSNDINIKLGNNTPTGTFEDLQNDIDSFEYIDDYPVVNLTRDYKATDETVVHIDQALTIEGNGHTIDCNYNCRALNLNLHSSMHIKIKNLKIINGFDKTGDSSAIFIDHGRNNLLFLNDRHVTLINCTFENNYAVESGGAIGVKNLDTASSTLTINIENCTFKGNSANQGGAIFYTETKPHDDFFSQYKFNLKNCNFIDNVAREGKGGAIFHDSKVILNIENCNFTKNHAKESGGAIYITKKLNELYIHNSNFTDNYADESNGKSNGGAIYTESHISLNKSSFINNRAENNGGAIYTRIVDSITDSYFEGNIAKKGAGGAIYDTGLDSGLKRDYVGNSEVITNSYFENNIANSNGGAVYIYYKNYVRCIKNSVFNNNLAITGKGGASYIDYINTRTDFIECNFTANKASGSKGGAIYAKGFVELDKCYFDNQTEDYSGAAYALKNKSIPGSFEDLQNEVDTPGIKVLNLYRDYTASKGTTIKISKNITINGNGHTIDCNKELNAFNLCQEGVEHINITMKNLRIINGKNKEGGAISIINCRFIDLINCTFENNEAEEKGGAIFVNLENTFAPMAFYVIFLDLENSTFKGNAANKGGAVYIDVGKYSSLDGPPIYIKNCNFVENTAKTDSSGAIYINCDIVGIHPDFDYQFIIGHLYTYIDDCNFTKNYANKGDGGAIQINGKRTVLTIKNSNFSDNYANGGVAKREGGAIYTTGHLALDKTSFINNWAENNGGAIYTRILDYIQDSYFKDNIAKKGAGGAVYVTGEDVGGNCKNEYEYSKNIVNSCFINNIAENGDGGAIYLNKDPNPYTFESGDIPTPRNVKNCTFNNNFAIKGDGGAIYSDSSSSILNLTGCKFTGNYANEGIAKREGGAIYTKGDIGLDKCYFKDNWAENQGGAIYTEKIFNFANTYFESNTAKKGDGGAIYINANVESKIVNNCTFKYNKAIKGDGGAIYSDSSSTTLNFIGCEFNGNYANDGITKRYGGGICSKGTANVDSCSFINNWAENYGGAIYSDEIGTIKNSNFISNHAKEGGAIYVNSKCSLTIEKSYFKLNKATNGRGGAVYMDSISSQLTLINNAFLNDDASDQGKETFNSGGYNTIKNNWWGENSPSFDNEKLMEYHAYKSNEKHKDGNPNTEKVSYTNEENHTTIKIAFTYAIPSAIANDISIFVNGGKVNITNININGTEFEVEIDRLLNESDLINVKINSAETKSSVSKLPTFIKNILNIQKTISNIAETQKTEIKNKINDIAEKILDINETQKTEIKNKINDIKEKLTDIAETQQTKINDIKEKLTDIAETQQTKIENKINDISKTLPNIELPKIKIKSPVKRFQIIMIQANTVADILSKQKYQMVVW